MSFEGPALSHSEFMDFVVHQVPLFFFSFPLRVGVIALQYPFYAQADFAGNNCILGVQHFLILQTHLAKNRYREIRFFRLQNLCSVVDALQLLMASASPLEAPGVQLSKEQALYSSILRVELVVEMHLFP